MIMRCFEISSHNEITGNVATLNNFKDKVYQSKKYRQKVKMTYSYTHCSKDTFLGMTRI